MAANGYHPSTTIRPLRAGIYAPILTFFAPDSEDLDIPTFESHVTRLAAAGVGPLIAGSMGEAIHLSHSERVKLIHAARKALDNAGFGQVPIIAGTGAGSTRETLELTNEAAAAGADYCIVIASGYFAAALANNRAALKAYFVEVSEKSPIPVMIYNYPGASGGIDLDSDLITELARECPNICGVKLTCANVGKLTRIADAIADPSFYALHPRKNNNAPFLVLGGYIDFLVPSSYANGHGAITGLANLFPNAIVHLFKLSEASKKDQSILAESQRVQGIIARADFTISKASIAGTKYLLERTQGYGGLPRKPLSPIESAAAQALWEHADTQAALKLERELIGKVHA
ncbi:Communesin biosynthesis cluster-specific transcription factor cnsN [Psilocybe cubensis]|uniref:Communesin biosynthesis cluster-specific transcription factor cnsN n=2 Tax=Psilocybe cubensis TaxID=181762 RepID=A0ACB8H877_PSICU|nr:Communesin biosynthesis cluster-specific transcription factor cnsN [Psilocybe cubensis]KAH9483914.1 Communesin biosynthesis cluster-specific transcription factor cnsN [Psilocybe cubensis]